LRKPSNPPQRDGKLKNTSAKANGAVRVEPVIVLKWHRTIPKDEGYDQQHVVVKQLIYH
jgi:hypothetical protein